MLKYKIILLLLTLIPNLYGEGNATVGVTQPTAFQNDSDMLTSWGSMQESKFFGKPYTLTIGPKLYDKTKKWNPFSQKQPNISLGKVFVEIKNWLKREFPGIQSWKVKSLFLESRKGDFHYFNITVAPEYSNQELNLYIDFAGKLIGPKWLKGKPNPVIILKNKN